MLVTHAMNAPVLMNVEQMKRAATFGAYIEFVGGSAARPDAAARLDRFAEAIRQIGPRFCVLSSDLGQRANPSPPDGFAAFLIAMKARGFTDQEIALMSRVNPARLLGVADGRMTRRRRRSSRGSDGRVFWLLLLAGLT